MVTTRASHRALQLVVPLAAAAVLTLGSPARLHAAGCELRGRFQVMVQALPQVIGSCTAAETYDATTGDLQQATVRGELRARGSDGALLFVEANPAGQTWVFGPNGLEARPHGSRFPWEVAPTPYGLASREAIGPEAAPELIGPPSADQTVVDANSNDNANTINNTNTITAMGGNATGGNANAQGGNSTNANTNAVNPVINVGVNTGNALPASAPGQSPAAPTPVALPALPSQPTTVPTPVPAAARPPVSTLAPTPFARPTPGGPADGLPTVARIELASGAMVVIALNPAGAPQTVRNFAGKAASGFYDGLSFHRVEDWVVQGGDPTGSGQGGGTIATELNDVPFRAGAIGMARGSDPMITNDAQFFIVKRDSPHLNGRYANFGHVTGGLEVLGQVALGEKIVRITVSP